MINTYSVWAGRGENKDDPRAMGYLMMRMQNRIERQVMDVISFSQANVPKGYTGNVGYINGEWM